VTTVEMTVSVSLSADEHPPVGGMELLQKEKNEYF
jgi:hypothetical protein